MRFIFITKVVIMICLLCACTHDSQIVNGEYSIGSVSFQDGVPDERKTEILTSLKSFKVDDGKIIFDRDSIISFEYRDGYIYMDYNGKSCKYECEDFSNDNQYSYELFVNEKEVKKITIISNK